MVLIKIQRKMKLLRKNRMKYFKICVNGYVFVNFGKWPRYRRLAAHPINKSRRTKGEFAIELEKFPERYKQYFRMSEDGFDFILERFTGETIKLKEPISPKEKLVVTLNTEIYNQVVEFIQNQKGLPIDEEIDLRKQFPNVSELTLSSIMAREWQDRVKKRHSFIGSNIKKFMQEYEKLSTETQQHDILLKIAVRERFPPFGLCRILLNDSYSSIYTKLEINEMLRNPQSIPDGLLAVNVSTCLYNDNRDGPIPDAIRQSIGEEYEYKLKILAREAGLAFFDEEDLRRIGFDKTPDLKLAVPFLYKGTVIHWIESKASFGDMESHKKYVKEQLISYGNRFGAGIVIYWFGFLDQILDYTENGKNICILDDFPDKSEIVLLCSDET